MMDKLWIVTTMKRKDSKTISLDLAPKEYESLKKLSAKFQISVTQLIRNMIKENTENKVWEAIKV